MAELKGPILFTGSVGGVRAYYDKVLKRYTLSTKGGSTKEIINNNPTMARQRENMSEFKACSKWASQLRKSLDSIGHLHYGYYYPDIVGLAKLIQKQDYQGIKGSRAIESSKYSKLLKSINFNKEHPFDQVFVNQYEILFSDDKQSITLKLIGFRSKIRINWPTHFESYRIALVCSQQPDWVWNTLDKKYRPIIDNLQFKSVTTFTDWRIPGNAEEDIILTASFASPALQYPGTTVVVALGLEVSAYPLDSSITNTSGVGTMKIVECFV